MDYTAEELPQKVRFKPIFLCLIALIVIFAITFWAKGKDKKAPLIAVAGVQANSDPLHPTEIYYGEAGIFNAKDMLKQLNVQKYPQDKIDVFPDPNLGVGSKITIYRALPVTIEDAGKSKLYRTWSNNVKELLKEQKLELLGKDSVEPSVKTPLRKNMRIIVTRVAEVEVTEKEPIEYDKIKKTTADLEKGDNEIQQKGKDGEKEVKYLIKRVNGVEVSKTKLESKTVSEPRDEIILVGIGPRLAKSGPHLDTINAAAKKYLINGTVLMCMMMRESGGSADAGYPDAMYKGLFQYSDGFWPDASAKAGYGGASVYDAGAQIYTTAWALTHGYTSRWPTYWGCADR